MTVLYHRLIHLVNSSCRKRLGCCCFRYLCYCPGNWTYANNTTTLFNLISNINRSIGLRIVYNITLGGSTLSFSLSFPSVSVFGVLSLSHSLWWHPRENGLRLQISSPLSGFLGLSFLVMIAEFCTEFKAFWFPGSASCLSYLAKRASVFVLCLQVCYL